MKLCECGCGNPSPISKQTNKIKGHVKGQPARFVPGHWAKTKDGIENMTKRIGTKHPNWKEKVTYGCLHSWLNRTYPRKNVCEECGNPITEYANISHQYLRIRSDWKELCRRCHRLFDGCRGETHHNAKLTKQDVDYIRVVWKTINHPSKSKLAVAFGVSKGLIGHIIHNRAWREI